MRIANNLSALTAYNSLNTTNNSLGKSIRKLSTGLRINQASDDAAGFAISEKMRSQISGLDVANRNARDGISFLQTAEGALGETNSMLQRMRELAVQASNDSLTSNDRHYIQLEINELKSQINRIAGTTQFNNKRILDGSSGAMWSSNDLNVKARINGGLTYIDEFGQKVSSEGNYRIEVTTEPGQAHIQKSGIYKTGYEEVITKTETVANIIGYKPPVPYEININDAVDTLGKTSGEGWEFEGGSTLKITKPGVYSVFGTGSPTSNHILVNPGVNATVFLRDVNVQTGSFALNMQGATVDLYLKGDNTLANTGGNHGAGIQTSSSSVLTISSADGDFLTSGKLTAKGSQHGTGIGGSCRNTSQGDHNGGTITIKGGTIIAQGGMGAAGIGGGNDGGSKPGTYTTITIEGGDITATGGAGGAGIGTGAGYLKKAPLSSNNGSIIIKGGTINANGGNSSSSYGQGAGIGGGGAFNSGHIEINNDTPKPSITLTGYIDPVSGQTDSIGVGEGGIVRDVTELSMSLPPARTIPDLPTYSEPITDIVKTVTEERTVYQSTLADTPSFYNSDGVFVLEQPQTITITQGNGKTASVTLYETDNMYDIAEKINDAIANTLGQKQYTDNPSKFCTIAEGKENTSESVYIKETVRDETSVEEIDVSGNPSVLSKSITTGIKGYDCIGTMLVRSAIPGKTGELYFSGDEDLLNALGLNTIQEAQESTYTASVYDAHSGASIATNIKSSAPEFKSIIPPEIDVEVDPMAGLSANWNEDTKRYILSGKETYTANLHLKDSGVIFQTGANKGEDFIVQLGDTSCDALGISGVNLLTREAASHAIGILDSAISKIASQRAKIGAYENALEHTMENLSVATLNLTSAESRIRDADMSKEMMKLVKWQILNQSGTSMLAQANQLPNNVLNLIKG